jgi:aryl-alcohol dehydrogenase-like predicted oxidoreductase
MQSGLLTDTFTAERVAKLPQDDWRRSGPEFQQPNLERNLALRDALRPIAQRHGVSVSAIAVAWTIAWPGLTGAIVGARSPEQVDGWISAVQVRLTRADLDEISAAISRTSAGYGPALPQRAAAQGAERVPISDTRSR